MPSLLSAISLIFLFSTSVADDCTKTVCSVNGNSLRFFIIGDWGGLPITPYFSPAEVIVAVTMGKMSEEVPTHFQLSLGDNVYLIGVKNEYDRRFKETFEDIFTAESLQTPWYPVGGNHDHYGNITGQIAYSKHSSRWVFPSLYYSVRYRLSDGTTVEILMIDTIVLCGNNRNLKFASLLEFYTTRQDFPPPLGAADRKAAEDHWRWIEERLRASTAKYLFVAGHFPIYSVGEHGPTSCLVQRLQPLLYRYKVSAYLCGHDHDLQHLKTTNNSWTLHHVLSGAGGFLLDSLRHEDAVPADSLQFEYPEHIRRIASIGLSRGGFVHADLNRTAGVFTYYRGDGKTLYEFQLQPRHN